ncbi:hypothetical protein [Anabaena azotica]|uniref:Uncharacterized protein n=1 Tax=Anabaena azotica FACHB-119 TaxID=947527 RepID=A0ABR8D8D3_9NOST|nr:hypothetical protein [Anabaena azotica]MBD2503455.1 hypothetical protein [Anabaena azotica FACHB-119]
MSQVLNFTGFIKNLIYRTYLNDNLKENSLDNFNINTANSYGLIKSPTADKSKKTKQVNNDKLGSQKFDNLFVNSQIEEILAYKQSALHWNKSLFEERFIKIFETALDSYDSISQRTGVKIHSRLGMNKYLQKITNEFEEFKNISLKNSLSASKREAITSHKLEYLVDGLKATFSIENYLGGIYYLTPDEILVENGRYIIQESKNTSKSSLPKLHDIQDGLFKLILFSNLDSLTLNEKPVSFVPKLKLTGKNVTSSIVFPEASSKEIENFITVNTNTFSSNQKNIIRKLALEAQNNNKLKIEISGNS